MTATLTFDEMYQAICRRDSGFVGVFITAVKTTGIFCLPTCTARKPKPRTSSSSTSARSDRRRLSTVQSLPADGTARSNARRRAATHRRTPRRTGAPAPRRRPPRARHRALRRSPLVQETSPHDVHRLPTPAPPQSRLRRSRQGRSGRGDRLPRRLRIAQRLRRRIQRRLRRATFAVCRPIGDPPCTRIDAARPHVHRRNGGGSLPLRIHRPPHVGNGAERFAEAFERRHPPRRRQCARRAAKSRTARILRRHCAATSKLCSTRRRPRSASASGTNCARSPTPRPAATPSKPAASANPPPSAPSPPPTAKTASPSSSPATESSAPTAVSPATAGDSRESSGCSTTNVAMHHISRQAYHYATVSCAAAAQRPDASPPPALRPQESN